MVYATAAQLETHLGESAYLVIADRDGDGLADADAVASSLEQASSVADSYLARYLPIPEAPKALVRAVLDIAVHELAGDRETDIQRKRYEDAIAWLRDVSKGAATIGLPIDAPTGAGPVLTAAPTRELTRESLRGVL